MPIFWKKSAFVVPGRERIESAEGLVLIHRSPGDCSPKYDIPSLKSSGLRAIPRLALEAGFEIRRREQNPACRGCEIRCSFRVRSDNRGAAAMSAAADLDNRSRPYCRRGSLWQAPEERKETSFPELRFFNSTSCGNYSFVPNYIWPIKDCIDCKLHSPKIIYNNV